MRLHRAVQVSCMVERTITIGDDLFGHGPKVTAGSCCRIMAG
ncbi:hypothetical protein [Caldicoprobacter algeriensis]|nr:hypothetical protein [Caldicoprobacter algeriensis]